MRVCLVLEGCYPYVNGGVSSWVHNYILATKDIEYILCTIYPNRESKGKFVYDIPDNVVEIVEYFMDDFEVGESDKKYNPSADFINETKNIIYGNDVNWNIIFDEVTGKKFDLCAFFKSVEYIKLVTDISENYLVDAGFSNAFFTLRSILTPIFYLLQVDIPDADLYHSIVTGYGGLLASCGSYIHNKPFVLSEHGIYPREREEELLQATWVIDSFRKVWIDFFYTLSKCSYKYAHIVTSLYAHAKDLQIEIGCDSKKCLIIPNGIHFDKYSKIKPKKDNGFIDIGAIIRFSPIKDIKTMLYAFHELKSKFPNARLHILGGTNDEEYKIECLNLIELLNLEDVLIRGQVNVLDTLNEFDFTILTSISEGQPLVILESFAAGRPVVCTDVGSCSEIIYGINKNEQPAGFCCKSMDSFGIANSMLELCRNKKLIETLGKNGQKRVENYYGYQKMLDNYKMSYEEAIKRWQE